MTEQKKKEAALPVDPKAEQRVAIEAAANKRLEALGNNDPQWTYYRGFLEGLDWQPAKD